MCQNPVAPYAFDGPYAGCYDNPVVAMDKRHVYMLHGVLCAWPFRSALEIGSFRGASATAFVEAINAGHLQRAEFCDVHPTQSLIAVANSCKGSVPRITTEPSWDVLDSAEVFDIVLVDANHDVASVTPELDRLKKRRPLCVMAHDTNATAAGYPQAEGALMLKRWFEDDAEYQCIEDKAQRSGERTERGLFLATRDPALHRMAIEVFEKWS